MPPPNMQRWRRNLTVEPVVLFYTFGIFMSLPVLTQYVYFRVSRFKGFPYNISETTEKGCDVDGGVNASLKELEKEVGCEPDIHEAASFKESPWTDSILAVHNLRTISGSLRHLADDIVLIKVTFKGSQKCWK